MNVETTTHKQTYIVPSPKISSSPLKSTNRLKKIINRSFSWIDKKEFLKHLTTPLNRQPTVFFHNTILTSHIIPQPSPSTMPRKKQPPNPKVPWQDIAQRAQTNRDATLALLEPPLPDLPTPRPKNVFSTLRSKLSREEIQITEMLPEDLLSKMAVSELSAVRVSTAFLRRAGLAQGLVSSSFLASFLFAFSRSLWFECSIKEEKEEGGL